MDRTIRFALGSSLLIGVLGVLCLPGLGRHVGTNASVADPGERVDYLRDVRPILSDHCYPCHGPDAQTREAGLRLDTKDGAFGELDAGYSAIVAGDLEESELYYRITTDSRYERMPPEDFGKDLEPEQIERLRAWIEQGAEWDTHWSFKPPTRPAVPAVSNAEAARGDIDRFILERLEAEDVGPSPEADAATLARRVSLDLTGLPPSVEELDAYLADESDDAYEALVDRLLESPRYGEHMARPWLDAARYGDTHGYHLDNERSLWRWRQWVIESMNDNMPFDQFTVEQLAGDLLPEPTQDQLIATGFNRCNPTTGEGGLIEEEYLAKYAMDRVDTTATVWMGMTLACSQCHDHKYDPLSQKEYYQFFSFFHSIAEEGTDRNAMAPPPNLRVPDEEQEARLAELDGQIAALTASMQGPIPATDRAQAEWEKEWFERLANQWQVTPVTDARSLHGSTLTAQEDGSVLASGENPAQDVYELTLRTDRSRITGLRLEGLTHESTQGGIGRASNTNIVMTDVEVLAAPAGDPDALAPVELTLATADYSQANYDITAAIDDNPKTGWAVDARKENRVAYFVPASPIAHDGGAVLKVTLRFESQFGQHALGRFRLSVSEDDAMTTTRRGPWSLAGPFTAPSANEVYATAYGPEIEAVRNAAADDTAADGEPLAFADSGWSWQERPDLVDGKIHMFEGARTGIYLRRQIDAPTARLLEGSFGSDDALKVWLNGRVVLDNNTRRPVEADQDRVTLQLQPGTNELLCKVVNDGGGFGFYFQVLSEEIGGVSPALTAVLSRPRDEWTDDEAGRVRDDYRRRDSAEWREMDDRRTSLQNERTTLEGQIPLTMITRERGEPRQAHLLIRGQYDNKGEAVQSGVPEVMGVPEQMPSTRLELARWLVSGEHPLTARVTVNRMWQHFFGTGLVKTAGDFGAQGEWPSHPALLDWLASEFVESGWDVKAMHRRIVTSATYRQSSRVRDDVRARDPDNRWLAYAPRPRLDAEVIRDAALGVSGLLVERIGGPSVKPYQPLGLWKAVGYTSSNTANFRQDQGDALFRRSLYTFWKRTSPPPNMQSFDAPSRESCVVRRSRTNTPLQALVLLNDVQFVEASRAFAERMLKDEGGVSSRIRRAFRMVTAREPDSRELAGLERFLEQAHQDFARDPESAKGLQEMGDAPVDASLDPVDVAAWTALCNLLLNLDEFVTRN